jgi:hypothetical protein
MHVRWHVLRWCSAKRCVWAIVPAYRVFGYGLHSDIELPELSPASNSIPVEWEIHSARASFVGDLGSALGSEAVYDGVQVRAFSMGEVRRLVFDDSGTFEIRPRNRRITWFPGSRASMAAVRADLLGRVLALAAHTDGHLALHASAVAIDGLGIAFLGRKHAGKSTLAMALVRGGARLITDDTLVVRCDAGGSVLAAPGVQRVRLWQDSARALQADVEIAEGPKPTIRCLTRSERMLDSVPLAACYVIDGEGAGAAAVTRRRLSHPAAAIAYVRCSKLGALMGGSESAAVLERAANLTRAVPVFAATVRRDLGALDALAASFIEWHTAHARASL